MLSPGLPSIIIRSLPGQMKIRTVRKTNDFTDGSVSFLHQEPLFVDNLSVPVYSLHQMLLFVDNFLFQCQFHWTVVRSEDLCVDLCSGQSVLQTLACDEVVDTPTCVLLSGLEPV